MKILSVLVESPEKQKLNFSHSALFHMRARVSKIFCELLQIMIRQMVITILIITMMIIIIIVMLIMMRNNDDNN